MYVNVSQNGSILIAILKVVLRIAIVMEYVYKANVGVS